jgi:hypothetical protein
MYNILFLYFRLDIKKRLANVSRYNEYNFIIAISSSGFGFTDRPVDIQSALNIINYFKQEAGVSLYSTPKKMI